MKNNWDNIRFFLALAKNKTLSGAGKELGVSHSTVQRRINAFERELNTHLFNRTESGYVKTAAGDALYREATQVQSTLNAISRQISDADDLTSGEVIITSTDTLSYFLLPEIVQVCNQKYPDLMIHLEMINSMSDMQNLQADIAIRTCQEPPANLIGRKIGSIEFAACASKEYIRAHNLKRFPERTADCHFVMLDKSYSDTQFYQWLDERVETRSKVTVTNGMLSAARLCAAGLGISLLPTYLLKSLSELQDLPCDGEPVTNDLWILSHPDLRDTARVRAVRQLLYDHLTPWFVQLASPAS